MARSDDWPFCECGVTLFDGELECAVCAGAPHDRECACRLCDQYWRDVEVRSRLAAREANRRLVCSCGWTGAFIEHHSSVAYGPVAEPGCVMSFRDIRRALRGDGDLPKRWTGSEWERA